MRPSKLNLWALLISVSFLFCVLSVNSEETETESGGGEEEDYVYYDYEDWYAVCPNGTDIDHSFCLPKDYRKLTKPDEHTYVELEFKIEKILAINDQEQTLTIAMDMTMRWNDSRFVVATTPWWLQDDALVHALALGGETIDLE